MPDTKPYQLVPVAFDPFASDGDARLPLTPQQSEVWVESQMGREASCAYNQCFVLHLSGALSVASMKNAFGVVLARHAALRASFDREGGEQRIAHSRSVEIAAQDLASLSASERERAIAAMIEAEANEPFDLENGPLLRARIVHESADRHRLIVTAHHIVCDGWSSSVMFSDLARAYAADRLGLEARLPEPMSYPEYVARECHRTDAAEDEAYWLGRFKDDVPVLDLPLDRGRPPARTRNGARETLAIEPSLYKQLKTLGAKSGATLYHTLLAGFETLLLRLSGQTELVVGIPTAGQAELENGHLVAHCVATLPLRCAVDPEARFADFLKTVRAGVLDAQAHQNVTFSSLVPKLPVERDPSRPVLVSVVFNIDKLGAQFDFGDLAVERIETPKRFVTFDLNVNVVDSGSELVVECEYNTDILEAETVARWLAHYRELLASAVREPTQSLSRLDIMTAQERQQMLVDWNRTEMPLPPTQLLHRMLEAQADRTSAAEALWARGERLTYAELDRRANRLAQHLAGQGVQRGDIVGVCLDRTADLVVSLFAVLKTGAAYVPLDPTYPADRIRFMLEDSGAKALVTQSSHEHLLEAAATARVLVDRDRDLVAACSDRRLEREGSSTDLAYVIYTSGSTGRPKGVAIEHRNAAAFVAWAAGVFDAEQIKGTLAATSVCFDLSIFEIFFPLAYGGRVIVADNAIALSTLEARDEVTLVNTVPSAIAELVRVKGIPGSVTTVNLAGEPLATSLVDEIYRSANVKLVYDLYGPTEDTTYSTFTLRQPGQPATIGRPLANGQAYILDRNMNPVPVGVPGEIYLGGAGVARGYLNRPELTAERFLANPFRPGPDSRLYRTGDLGRYRADGNIEYLGRIDNQVKVRGFRIELGEIEAALDSHPAVRQATVITREASAGDVRILAYVVLHDGEDLTVSDVRRHLRSSLPDYMIPSFVMTLPSLPLTANGKIDRKALPDPFRTAVTEAAASEPPAPGMETTVAEIWREALKVETINAADNFFDLGGHSLLAVRVTAALERKIGWRMDPRTLFFQSLRQVAQSAEAATQRGALERIA